jgi:hypothetical protein
VSIHGKSFVSINGIKLLHICILTEHREVFKKKKRKERKKMTMGKPGDFSAMEAYEEVVCFR